MRLALDCSSCCSWNSLADGWERHIREWEFSDPMELRYEKELETKIMAHCLTVSSGFCLKDKLCGRGIHTQKHMSSLNSCC